MRFEWAPMLWLLPGVVLLLWLNHRRPAVGVSYSSLQLVSAVAESWRTRWVWFPEAVGALAICSLMIALARPQVRVLGEPLPERGIAIELLVDVSKSMESFMPSAAGESAGTTELTRLAVVKEVLPRFIRGDGRRLTGRPNDLIGLIAFARYADTISPQTSAHDALVEMIGELNTASRPNEDGTAYGDAVTLAAARLQASASEADVKSRVIVLLTDGENNCGRHLPLEATALAKKWGIRVYVISLAKAGDSGAPADDAAAPVSMAEQILMRMARETGGIYRAANDKDALEAVCGQIDALERSAIKGRKQIEHRDIFPLLIGIGLTLLGVETVLRSTVLRRIP